jgi:hypothetical protein
MIYEDENVKYLQVSLQNLIMLLVVVLILYTLDLSFLRLEVSMYMVVQPLQTYPHFFVELVCVFLGASGLVGFAPVDGVQILIVRL